MTVPRKEVSQRGRLSLGAILRCKRLLKKRQVIDQRVRAASQETWRLGLRVTI